MDVLAIDGGKTKTLVASYRNGAPDGVVRGAGLENIAAPHGPAAIRATLKAALADLPGEHRNGDDRWDVVVIGLTSVYAPSPEAEKMLDILAEIVGAPRLVVTSDVVTTYCGALGLASGAVVAAGTGSIALGLNERGESARVDGWGYLVGDEGSGFAVGQAGLRSALRARDGRGGSSLLLELAAARFGSVARITPEIYGSTLPPRTIASFSAEVARAAEAGDVTALQIWQDAADALAETVVTAAERIRTPGDERVRISWSGGLFAAEELLLHAFREAVATRLPDAVLQAPAGTALEGATLLAENADEPLLASVVAQRRQ